MASSTLKKIVDIVICVQTIGLLLSQVLGIEQILGTNDGWPVLLGLAICPAILQLILLPICPESPRYLLITKQWEEEARKGWQFKNWAHVQIYLKNFFRILDENPIISSALRRLRASNQVEEDIEEMRAEERAQQSESSISIMELICSPTLRAPLIIGIVMQLSQQLSGINAVSGACSYFHRWKCSFVVNHGKYGLMCSFFFLPRVFFCIRYFIIPLHSSWVPGWRRRAQSLQQ